MRLSEIGRSLEIPSLLRSASRCSSRLRRAIYTSSLLWKLRPLKCCFGGSDNKVNVPAVSSDGAASSVASDMRRHAEGSHLGTEHLFGSLRQNLDGRRFCSNEKFEMAMSEWLRLEKSAFHRDGIFERSTKLGNASLP